MSDQPDQPAEPTVDEQRHLLVLKWMGYPDGSPLDEDSGAFATELLSLLDEFDREHAPLRAQVKSSVDRDWWWVNLVGRNGETVFTSENHPDKRDAVHAAGLAGVDPEHIEWPED